MQCCQVAENTISDRSPTVSEYVVRFHSGWGGGVYSNVAAYNLQHIYTDLPLSGTATCALASFPQSKRAWERGYMCICTKELLD